MKITRRRRPPKELRDLLASRDQVERSAARKLIDLSGGSIDSAAKKWQQAVQIALATREIDGDIGQAERLAIETIGAPDRPASISPVRISPMPLPAPCEPLVGRADALSAAVRVMVMQENIAIYGPPGAGKTEFSAALLQHEEIAKSSSDRFWVPCDAATSPALLCNSVCRSLGIPSSQEPMADIIDAARGLRHPVFVFDGIDSPWRSDPGATEDLLKQLAPFSQLVITSSGSQRPAGVAWTTIRLQPLPVEQTCELFEVMLERPVPPEAQVSLWRATEGLPLAIIALANEAQQEPSLGVFFRDATDMGLSFIAPPRLAKRLETALALIATTSQEVQSLCRLALCPDGLDLEDVVQACSMGTALRRRALGSGLVQQVAYLEAPAGRRYRLRILEPMRLHLLATQVGVAPNDRTELLSCLLRHFVTKSLALEKFERTGATPLSMLTLRWDLANYVALLPSLPSDDDDSMRTRISAIGSVLRWARRIGVDVTHPLLNDLEGKVGERPSPTDEALMHVLRGDLALADGNTTLAKTAYAAAIIAAPVNTSLAANAQKRLADSFFCASELEDAYGLYGKAVDSYQAARSDLGRANCLMYLGELSLRDGQLDRAREHIATAMILYGNVHDLLGITNCRFLQAEVEVAMFETTSVEGLLMQVEAEYESLGADLGRANCYIRLAELAMLSGKIRSRDDNLHRAELLAKGTRNALALGHVTELKGRRVGNSSVAEALAYYDEAESLFRGAGDVLGASWSALQRSALLLVEPGTSAAAKLNTTDSGALANPVAIRDFRWNAVWCFSQERQGMRGGEASEYRAAVDRIPSETEKQIFLAASQNGSIESLLASLPETRSFITFSAEPPRV